VAASAKDKKRIRDLLALATSSGPLPERHVAALRAAELIVKTGCLDGLEEPRRSPRRSETPRRSTYPTQPHMHWTATVIRIAPVRCAVCGKGIACGEPAWTKYTEYIHHDPCIL
jgi:hypothetical protein